MIRATLGHLKAVAVLDRSDALNNHAAPLCLDVTTALYSVGSRPRILNYIYGLGGRDIKPADIQKVFGDLEQAARGHGAGDNPMYLGVRE
jgi:pyruvate ferredoxin oxidoreductase alpha subunit